MFYIFTSVFFEKVINFDMEKCIERARRLNPDIKVFPLSAKTGEGMDAWTGYLRSEINKWRENN